MNELETLILHAYPWWEMQRVRQMSTYSKDANRPTCNVWRHTALLIDHNYKGVTTPNCDTLYSGAWLDLAHGPVLIEVPTSDLPYWSVAVMDLNTDNIAVMGNRYPGTQSLIVCDHDFQGNLPTDVPHVRSKSQVVWLLARYLIGNDALVATAEAMRRGASISQWPVSDTERVAAASLPRSTLIPALRKDPQNFWEIIRATLNEDPALVENMARDAQFDPTLAWPDNAKTWQDLSADFQLAFSDSFLKTLTKIAANNSGNMQTHGQWRYPGPDIGRFGDNAMYRAEVALWGLGALETKEVIYVSTFTDIDGNKLDGAHNYRFQIPPEGIPALAFWSLTMYERDPLGGMYFTGSTTNRYAIGDRTEGLTKNDDGSIDIWMGHSAPPLPHQVPNWLPAPAGRFTLMLRVYAPKPEFESAKVLPPSVNKWRFE